MSEGRATTDRKAVAPTPPQSPDRAIRWPERHRIEGQSGDVVDHRLGAADDGPESQGDVRFARGRNAASCSHSDRSSCRCPPRSKYGRPAPRAARCLDLESADPCFLANRSAAPVRNDARRRCMCELAIDEPRSKDVGTNETHGSGDPHRERRTRPCRPWRKRSGGSVDSVDAQGTKKRAQLQRSARNRSVGSCGPRSRLEGDDRDLRNLRQSHQSPSRKLDSAGGKGRDLPGTKVREESVRDDLTRINLILMRMLSPADSRKAELARQNSRSHHRFRNLDWDVTSPDEVVRVYCRSGVSSQRSPKNAASATPAATARSRLIDVEDGPVGQLRHLPGVVEVVVLAEREAAVEHDVLLRVERVRIDQHRHVMPPRRTSCRPCRAGCRSPSTRSAACRRSSPAPRCSTGRPRGSGCSTRCRRR